ncbi:hypothetical protein H0I23_05235 [Cellulophaga sp. HaHaR_3_176]|uniref:hypothetical protein n=1 Tax=Cellulophaga sp. HaHaR_3_176 TaxID=1942464 RepID=UPI001C1F8EBE|nr:hypothetical protein [Cellulophaga sp. HaHaR_3_176]QWX85041.1 hypothetical protein H0I23_05235 [Cellulophaga sp. HaHaR_3_176]
MENLINDIGTEISQHGLACSSILCNKESFNTVVKLFYLNYYKVVSIYTFKILELNSKNLKVRLLRVGDFDGKKTDPA